MALRKISDAGLAFQTFSFSAYFIVWTIVTWNLLRLCKSSRQTAASPAASSRHLLPYARNLALLLGLVSLFVQIRTIFRLAESAQGFFAYLDVRPPCTGACENGARVAVVLALVM